jgi:cold shock protein
VQIGKLKFFNHDRGYGFIAPDDGSRGDVFVHIGALKRSGIEDVAEGVRLSFEIEPATPSPKPVTNVTNSVNNVTNKTTAPLTNAAERYLKRLEADRKRAARWRDKNRERYNSYMCGLMRKRREAKAEARAAT